MKKLMTMIKEYTACYQLFYVVLNEDRVCSSIRATKATKCSGATERDWQETF
jgi:hypothetical protein